MNELTEYVMCRKCGGFGRRDLHVCPPLWDWKCVDYPDDEWSEVMARDPESAAEKAAELYDQEDYPLVRNSGISVLIMVRDRKTGKVTIWSCHGESLPHYYANQVES